MSTVILLMRSGVSFRAPVGHATHFGVHVYGHHQEIGFAHLSWLTDAAELTGIARHWPRTMKLPEGWDQKSGYAGRSIQGRLGLAAPPRASRPSRPRER